MDLRDRRIIVAVGGAAVALAAGGLIAWTMIADHRGETPPPPPASKAGLIIESNTRPDRIDPERGLRCFVDGQFVGEMSLAACARRNGVATEALDVGADPSGALAGSAQAGTVLTPLPPEDVTPPALQVPPQGGPVGACWRYTDGQWRKLPSDTTLDGCVQALFAGRCERPGSASYGRFMQQTLRLVPGRVEVSSDDRSFRTLVEQGGGCALPAVG